MNSQPKHTGIIESRQASHAKPNQTHEKNWDATVIISNRFWAKCRSGGCVPSKYLWFLISEAPLPRAPNRSIGSKHNSLLKKSLHSLENTLLNLQNHKTRTTLIQSNERNAQITHNAVKQRESVLPNSKNYATINTNLLGGESFQRFWNATNVHNVCVHVCVCSGGGGGWRGGVWGGTRKRTHRFIETCDSNVTIREHRRSQARRVVKASQEKQWLANKTNFGVWRISK